MDKEKNETGRDEEMIKKKLEENIKIKVNSPERELLVVVLLCVVGR